MFSLLVWISLSHVERNDTMATKVVSLLELIAKRGAIIRAPTVPNGSSSIDWLERWLFQSNEEREQAPDPETQPEEQNGPRGGVDEQPIIGNAIPHAVIATPDMIKARVDFSRDYWRSLIRDTTTATSHETASEGAFPVPGTMSFPAPCSGEEYLYYAQ